ncbi:MAG: HEPN domain-containing protein [bacterium]|nr:HEPN domain-containing protein [bacterium]
MDIEEIVQYWVGTAEDDWKVVQHLFEKGDYAYSLFFAHLYLEKLFKAMVVKETKGHAPPIHNLQFLAEKANIALTDKQSKFILEVNKWNIKARYPDFKLEFKRQCTERFTEEQIKEIGALGEWLKKRL